MSKDGSERFLVLRFTSQEKIREFHKVLEESGFLDNLNKVSGDKEEARVEKDGEDKGNGSLWSKLGASHYDEKSSESYRDGRVVTR